MAQITFKQHRTGFFSVELEPIVEISLMELVRMGFYLNEKTQTIEKLEKIKKGSQI